MQVSIIIPTIRPKTIQANIKRINEVSSGMDYEIIIVSPYDMTYLNDLSHVKFVKEEPRIGKYSATNLGASIAIGDYLMTMGDYFFIGRDCLKNLIEFSELHKDELFITAPKIHDLWEVHLECHIYDGLYYTRIPFIHRKHLSKIDGFMNKDLKHLYGDVDIAMRVYYNGGTVEPCTNAFVEVFNTKTEDSYIKPDSNIEKEETSIFEKKWDEIFTDSKWKSRKKLPSLPNQPTKSTEKTNRIVRSMIENHWDELKEIIKEDYFISEYIFPELLGYVLFMWKFIPLEKRSLLIDFIVKEMIKKPYILSYKYLLNKLKRKHDNTINRFFVGYEETPLSRIILITLLSGMVIIKINQLCERREVSITDFFGKTIIDQFDLLSACKEESIELEPIRNHYNKINSITNVEEFKEWDWTV